ncbi:hypothetical protein ACFV2H_13015 [Streptomyces sp. NPDC059629]
MFLRVNVVITAAWAGTGLKVAFQVLGFVVPAVFTARYPKIVRARYAR